MSPEQVAALLTLMADLRATISAQSEEIAQLRAQLDEQGQGS